MKELLWYAVKVRPNQRQILRPEYASDPVLAPFLVEDRLAKQGFEVFVPRRAVYRLNNRYTKQKVAKARPLLTGWLFVGVPAGENRWRELMATTGVIGVAGAAGKPHVIPDARIRQLQQRWSDGVVKAHERERFMRSRKEYRPGDEARVVSGPYAESVVKVVDVRGVDARVLLRIFGANREVTVNTMMLEAA